jgi:hypothetical protein
VPEQFVPVMPPIIADGPGSWMGTAQLAYSDQFWKVKMTSYHWEEET